MSLFLAFLFLRQTCADVVLVVLGINGAQVALQQVIRDSWELEQLTVVLDIVDARIDLFKVAQSKLLFFEI